MLFSFIHKTIIWVTAIAFIYVYTCKVQERTVCADCKAAILAWFNEEEAPFPDHLRGRLLFEHNSTKLYSKQYIHERSKRIAKHLDRYSYLNIKVTGKCLPKECKLQQPPISQLRAEQIKTYLIEAGIPSNRITLANEIDTDLEQWNGWVVDGALFKFVNRLDAFKLGFLDKIALGTHFEPNQFGFEVDSLANLGIEEAINYLNGHPKARVKISGSYLHSEFDSSNFKNLGMARSDSLLRYLLSRGIDENQLAIGPANINSPNVTLSLEENLVITKEVEQRLLLEPIKLYFKLNDSNLKVDDDLEEYFAYLEAYLEQESERNIVLTGHTDNLGQKAYNYQLGLRRAKDVKAKLFKYVQVDTSRIIIRSGGSTQPIASNKTEEGRNQNRRVEIKAE